MVAITYSAIGERSKDFPEEMVLQMKSLFVVSALVGISLAWTMPDVLLGLRAQIVYSLVTLVVALVWCKIMMICFATDSMTPKSFRREQTMMIV